MTPSLRRRHSASTPRRPRAGVPTAVLCLAVGLGVPVHASAQNEPERPAQETRKSQDPARQDQNPSKGEGTGSAGARAAVRAMLEQFEEAGIRLDRKAKTLAIDATVNRPDQLLEYLLIDRKGKTHEALLVSDVKPSLLNAAFLTLGLEPGTNARTEEIEPRPSLEEVEAGAPWFRVIPPTGPELWLTAKWTDEESGEQREMAVEDFVIDVETGLWVEDNTWYYIGGRVAPPYRNDPPVFMADLEGNLVSLPYMSPGNHLVAMHHERSTDEQNWWIAKKCPPPGQKVSVVFHTVKPKLVVDREARLAKERAEREKESEVEGEGQGDGPPDGPTPPSDDGTSGGGGR